MAKVYGAPRYHGECTAWSPYHLTKGVVVLPLSHPLWIILPRMTTCSNNKDTLCEMEFDVEREWKKTWSLESRSPFPFPFTFPPYERQGTTQINKRAKRKGTITKRRDDGIWFWCPLSSLLLQTPKPLTTRPFEKRNPQVAIELSFFFPFCLSSFHFLNIAHLFFSHRHFPLNHH